MADAVIEAQNPFYYTALRDEPLPTWDKSG
jgi:hypothetical protein